MDQDWGDEGIEGVLNKISFIFRWCINHPIIFALYFHGSVHIKKIQKTYTLFLFVYLWVTTNNAQVLAVHFLKICYQQCFGKYEVPGMEFCVPICGNCALAFWVSSMTNLCVIYGHWLDTSWGKARSCHLIIRMISSRPSLPVRKREHQTSICSRPFQHSSLCSFY